ncbi:MAG: hypothetical protein ACTSQJ_08985 [Promethearchaeota archaeon]
MLEILEASYEAGARGIEAIPIGKIMEVSRIMAETHSDYVITGSTYPGKDSKIEILIEAGAKLIFVHGMVSDNKGRTLTRLLEAIASRNVIPGIATHDPIPTLKYAIQESLNVKAFLVPFNFSGKYMGNAKELEKMVDEIDNYSFVGMKTLAAGTLKPEKAFNYISKHNICSITIGIVEIEEAKQSIKVALKYLMSKKRKDNV